MAYTRVNWEDTPSTNTPRNATNLNKMDKGIKDLDDGKQDLLVSGTNIKTINNQSILGSGNIDTNLHYYSEDETLYGYDTDGEPVYEKTLIGTTASSGSAITLMSGISELLEANGYIKLEAGHNMMVNSTFGDNNSNAIRVYMDSGSRIQMQFPPSSAYQSRPYKVTARYKKLSSASLLSIQSEGE